MAPELWKRKPAPQSDLYSLAIILYEMITGKYPFKGKTPNQILAKQISSVPRLPIREDRLFPLALNDFILKSLSVEVEDRHTSATDFADQLRKILHNRQKSKI
jgi:serine/threonine-protein kinase